MSFPTPYGTAVTPTLRAQFYQAHPSLRPRLVSRRRGVFRVGGRVSVGWVRRWADLGTSAGYAHLMIAPASSRPAVSDEQVFRTFTFITVFFCVPLVLFLALGVFVLVPNGSVHARGMIIGVALALVSWFASRWITSNALSRAARTGIKDPAGAVGAVVFRGVACAEIPALVGLLLAVADRADVGPFVIAIPVAIVAVVVNASGPGAVLRHLDQLRA